jgi:hypothetical protein
MHQACVSKTWASDLSGSELTRTIHLPAGDAFSFALIQDELLVGQHLISNHASRDCWLLAVTDSESHRGMRRCRSNRASIIPGNCGEIERKEFQDYIPCERGESIVWYESDWRECKNLTNMIASQCAHDISIRVTIQCFRDGFVCSHCVSFVWWWVVHVVPLWSIIKNSSFQR